MTDRRSLKLVGRMWIPGLVVTGIAVTWMLTAGGTAAEKKVEGAKSASAAKGESDKSEKKPPLGQITVLVPKKDFKTEGKNKALRVSYDDIDIEKVLNTKTLTLDIPKKMPEWQRKLDGQRIRLRGYMHPASAFQESGIKRFVLCRDTSACCFGPNPTVYYLVEVTMKSGTSTNYLENKAMDVEGVFRIEPHELEGSKEKDIDHFYYLDDAQVVK